MNHPPKKSLKIYFVTAGYKVQSHWRSHNSVWIVIYMSMENLKKMSQAQDILWHTSDPRIMKRAQIFFIVLFVCLFVFVVVLLCFYMVGDILGMSHPLCVGLLNIT